MVISATNFEFKQTGLVFAGTAGLSGVRLGTVPGVPAIGATTGVSVAGSPLTPTVAVDKSAGFCVALPVWAAWGVWVAGAVVGVSVGAEVGEACKAIFVNSTIAVAAAAVLTAAISTVGVDG